MTVAKRHYLCWQIWNIICARCSIIGTSLHVSERSWENNLCSIYSGLRFEMDLVDLQNVDNLLEIRTLTEEERERWQMSTNRKWTIRWPIHLCTNAAVSTGTGADSLQRNILFQPPHKMIFIDLGGNDFNVSGRVWILRFIQICTQTGVIFYNVYGAATRRKKTWLLKLRADGSSILDANNSTFILKREVLFHDIDYQTHGIFSHWCVHLSEVGLDMNLDDVREKILPLINN